MTKKENYSKRKLMKQKLFLLTFFAILLLAFSPQPLQAQPPTASTVTLTAKNEPMRDVFKKIEKKTRYKFLFALEDITQYRVSCRLKNVTIHEAMRQIVGLNPLRWKVEGNFVTVSARKQAETKASGRERTIKGYVRDENGEELVGVPVCIGESRVCTVTDADGFYTFKIPVEPTVLKFSYVGLATQYVQIAQGGTDVVRDVVLRSDNKVDEVVVTGIFRKAKESYTGAVSTIDREDLDLYRGSNLLQTLKNVDASLSFPINNAVGSDPNTLPNLNIRGSSTLPMNVEEFNANAGQTVNTPLVILDGFEISLTKLMDYNDDQIESINILKDAAATAIYGSRGANGVIVVITKQPKEGKIRVSAKAGVSLEVPDLSSYDVLNARQILELQKRIGLYDGGAPTMQLAHNRYYNERLQEVLNGTDVDWLHKPVHTGVGQVYNARLDGGAQAFRWAASLGYNDVSGAMKGSSRKNLNADITLMYSTHNFIFRNYTTVTSNHARQSKYGSFSDYVDMLPYNNPYDANGNIVQTFPDFDHNDQSPVGNPLWDASLNTVNKSEYFTFINNFSLEWLIIDGLRLRAKLGVTTTRSSSDYFLPKEHSYFTTATYQTASGQLRKGLYRYGSGTDNALNGNVTMSYSKTFADKHQVYVGLDYSVSNEKLYNYLFTAEGFSNSSLNFIGNASQYALDSTPSASRSKTRMVGFTGNASYTFDNRYYADLSYRVDGSSKFGSDKRFAPFWSVGVGWNIHNEKFMQRQHVFSNLRLKASYGVTGTQDFTTESAYTTFKYTPGQRYLSWTSATIMGLGNSDLTWQKTKEWNVGFEAGLLKQRVVAEFNWYDKRTSNLLSYMDLPLSSGFASYTSNVGSMKNTGFDASLNVYVIRDYKKRLNLLLGGQFVYNKNEITSLSDAIKEQNEQYLAQNVDVSNLFYEGRPLNAIYAVRSAGIDPSTGREVFIDRDGNKSNTWNPADKVYLGTSDQPWRGNFRAMLMYANFTFNVSFGYHWGGKLYNSTLRDRVEISRSTIGEKNVDARVLSSRWMQAGDNTFFRNFDDVETHATSRYVFDDRVLELQSLSLQYRWNSQWLRNLTGLESIVFAVNASDLFYWSTVKYERGTSYPYARNIQGTVTLTF